MYQQVKRLANWFSDIKTNALTNQLTVTLYIIERHIVCSSRMIEKQIFVLIFIVMNPYYLHSVFQSEKLLCKSYKHRTKNILSIYISSNNYINTDKITHVIQKFNSVNVCYSAVLFRNIQNSLKPNMKLIMIIRNMKIV